jgi:hypothetical protein
VEVAFVEIELVFAHIGCEEDVCESVVVDVTDGHPAAVVEISEEEAVGEFPVYDLVVEFDAGIVEEGEECAGLFMATGAKKAEEEGGKAFEDSVSHKKTEGHFTMAFGEIIDSGLNPIVNIRDFV